MQICTILLYVWQGERRTIAYFAWPNRDAIIQGPAKKYPAIYAADLMASEGNAYASRKDDDTWKEVSCLAFGNCVWHLGQIGSACYSTSIYASRQM